MSTSEPTLADAANAFASALVAHGVPGALIGGLAISLHARPRATRDVDAVLWLPTVAAWPGLVLTLGKHGLTFRPGGSVEFAHVSRVLLLRHDASGVDIDASLGAMPFEEELVREATVLVGSGIALPVARPEDLVILKAIAARPRDLVDISALLECHPEIARARVRAHVASAAEALEAPELVETLDRLFAAVPTH